ncbi:MAG: ABC transporter ATP-binding protein [Chloroflexota bacterium]
MTLQLAGINHQYPSPLGKPRQILNGINWDIEGGSQILLRGVSGSGKTTLFNIIAGLMRPSSGTVTLDGTDIYGLSEAKRDRFRSTHIGYVFQTHYLLPTLSARENVVMPMVYGKRFPQAEHKARAEFLLEQVGLDSFGNYLPRQLSTGQRMRVAVARALANQPMLLLSDEPTASLDEESANQVMDLMQSIAEKEKAILLVSSHDPALMTRFTQHANLAHGHLAVQEVTRS